MKFLNMTRVYMSPETGGEAPASTDTPVAEVEVEATPVVEPVKEVTPVEPTDTKLPEKEVDKSKLGQVTGLIEQSGLTMKEVAEYAKANNGDVDLDTMVALKEKHGDAIASLIADQIKDIHTTRTNEANARDRAVYDQVKEAFADITSDPEQTGESMWSELATWTKEETDGKPNVSTEHRNEINTMLAQGGLAAKLAVQELTSAFKESLGSQDFQEAELLEADQAAQATGGGTITKQDYTMELRKLEAAGHVYGQSSEIKKLDARRMKSIQRGQ